VPDAAISFEILSDPKLTPKTDDEASAASAVPEKKKRAKKTVKESDSEAKE
jgi:hypothetical protein